MAQRYKKFVDEYEKQSEGKAHPGAMKAASAKAESTKFRLTGQEEKEYKKEFGGRDSNIQDTERIKRLSEAKKTKLRQMMAKSIVKNGRKTVRTEAIEGSLREGGLTEEEIARFR